MVNFGSVNLEVFKCFLTKSQGSDELHTPFSFVATLLW